MEQMEQGSEAWLKARMGKVTGSRVADLMAKTKSGYSTSRQNYLAELVCERLTGKPTERFTNEAMRHGTESEPFARSTYELKNGILVDQVGFLLHPDLPEFGASPDGCINGDGLLEIKCPNTWTHIETLKSGKPQGKYYTQMQAQLAVTGRAWCDFVSFDDRLPESLAYFQVRIPRDDGFIRDMLGEIRGFLDELNDLIESLQARVNTTCD